MVGIFCRSSHHTPVCISEFHVTCSGVEVLKPFLTRFSAGYGARFIRWVAADDPKPYGSYGNGSAMRVSAAGWVGYILRIDRKAIYIAGDTDVTKESKAVKCDIALVPIMIL